jgi:hypothetical protein
MKRSASTKLKAGREIASPQRGAKRLERARSAEAAYIEAAKDYQDGAKLMALGLSRPIQAPLGTAATSQFRSLGRDLAA